MHSFSLRYKISTSFQSRDWSSAITPVAPAIDGIPWLLSTVPCSWQKAWSVGTSRNLMVNRIFDLVFLAARPYMSGLLHSVKASYFNAAPSSNQQSSNEGRNCDDLFCKRHHFSHLLVIICRLLIHEWAYSSTVHILTHEDVLSGCFMHMFLQ